MVLAARDGDARARAWIVERYTPAVYRFCMRFLRNEEDARDVTQDTLIKVMRNLHRFDPKRRFSTWVFSIARNTAIDETRRRKRLAPEPKKEPAYEGPSPMEETRASRRADRLHEALAELPPKYREVLVLYHFEHLKYQEIADALEIPIGTVMNRIFRARQRLRSIYDTDEYTLA
ncbi:MAG: sigma-70 family RNA polymerase sigma factor [Myxococcota bacterium]|nr:sigma-70 family RNA polymerase sigma factor [Myxococcota bacterium]